MQFSSCCGLVDGFDGLLCGDFFRTIPELGHAGFPWLFLGSSGHYCYGSCCFPIFCSIMSQPLRVRRDLDIDGFLFQLFVELYGFVSERLVLPKEVSAFGVSPQSLCFGLDLLF